MKNKFEKWTVDQINIKVDPNNGMTKDDEAQLLQKLFSEKYKSEGEVDADAAARNSLHQNDS